MGGGGGCGLGVEPSDAQSTHRTQAGPKWAFIYEGVIGKEMRKGTGESLRCWALKGCGWRKRGSETQVV